LFNDCLCLPIACTLRSIMGPIPRTDGTATFNVEFPTGLGEYVVLVGSAPELGYWNIERGVKMHTSKEDFPFWTSPPISLSLPRQGPVCYKYVMVKADGRTEWEICPDRKIERSSFDNLMQQDVSIHDVASLDARTNDAPTIDGRQGRIRLDSTTTWVSRAVMTLLGTWMLAAVVHAVFGLLRNDSKYGHGHRPRNGYYGDDKYGQRARKYGKGDSMRSGYYGYDGYDGYDQSTSYSKSHSYSQGQSRRQKLRTETGSAELPVCVLAGFIAGAGAVSLYRRDEEERRRGSAGKNNMLQRFTR